MRTFLRRTLEAAVLTGGFTLLGAGVAAGIAAADTGSGNSVVAPISVPTGSGGAPAASGNKVTAPITIPVTVCDLSVSVGGSGSGCDHSSASAAANSAPGRPRRTASRRGCS